MSNVSTSEEHNSVRLGVGDLVALTYDASSLSPGNPNQIYAVKELRACPLLKFCAKESDNAQSFTCEVVILDTEEVFLSSGLCRKQLRLVAKANILNEILVESSGQMVEKAETKLHRSNPIDDIF